MNNLKPSNENDSQIVRSRSASFCVEPLHESFINVRIYMNTRTRAHWAGHPFLLDQYYCHSFSVLDDHCVFISILACQNVFSQQDGDREGESDSFVCLSVFAAEYPYMHWADRLPPDLGTAD